MARNHPSEELLEAHPVPAPPPKKGDLGAWHKIRADLDKTTTGRGYLALYDKYDKTVAYLIHNDPETKKEFQATQGLLIWHGIVGMVNGSGPLSQGLQSKLLALIAVICVRLKALKPSDLGSGANPDVRASLPQLQQSIDQDFGDTFPKIETYAGMSYCQVMAKMAEQDQ